MSQVAAHAAATPQIAVRQVASCNPGNTNVSSNKATMSMTQVTRTCRAKRIIRYATNRIA